MPHTHFSDWRVSATTCTLFLRGSVIEDECARDDGGVSSDRPDLRVNVPSPEIRRHARVPSQ